VRAMLPNILTDTCSCCNLYLQANADAVPWNRPQLSPTLSTTLPNLRS
jgi:hypothetical protein